MSIIFKTESGSEYEFWPDGEDLESPEPCIRRLTGVLPPTERQTAGWRNCLSAGPIDVGSSVIIHWGWNPDGSANCTVTSRVTKVTHA